MQSAFPKVLRSPLEDQAPSEVDPLSDRAWDRGRGQTAGERYAYHMSAFLFQGNWVTNTACSPKTLPKATPESGHQALHRGTQGHCQVALWAVTLPMARGHWGRGRKAHSEQTRNIKLQGGAPTVLIKTAQNLLWQLVRFSIPPPLLQRSMLFASTNPQ